MTNIVRAVPYQAAQFVSYEKYKLVLFTYILRQTSGFLVMTRRCPQLVVCFVVVWQVWQVWLHRIHWIWYVVAWVHNKPTIRFTMAFGTAWERFISKKDLLPCSEVSIQPLWYVLNCIHILMLLGHCTLRGTEFYLFRKTQGISRWLHGWPEFECLHQVAIGCH